MHTAITASFDLFEVLRRIQFERILAFCTDYPDIQIVA